MEEDICEPCDNDSCKNTRENLLVLIKQRSDIAREQQTCNALLEENRSLRIKFDECERMVTGMKESQEKAINAMETAQANLVQANNDKEYYKKRMEALANKEQEAEQHYKSANEWRDKYDALSALAEQLEAKADDAQQKYSNVVRLLDQQQKKFLSQKTSYESLKTQSDALKFKHKKLDKYLANAMTVIDSLSTPSNMTKQKNSVKDLVEIFRKDEVRVFFNVGPWKENGTSKEKRSDIGLDDEQNVEHSSPKKKKTNHGEFGLDLSDEEGRDDDNFDEEIEVIEKFILADQGKPFGQRPEFDKKLAEFSAKQLRPRMIESSKVEKWPTRVRKPLPESIKGTRADYGLVNPRKIHTERVPIIDYNSINLAAEKRKKTLLDTKSANPVAAQSTSGTVVAAASTIMGRKVKTVREQQNEMMMKESVKEKAARMKAEHLAKSDNVAGPSPKEAAPIVETITSAPLVEKEVEEPQSSTDKEKEAPEVTNQPDDMSAPDNDAPQTEEISRRTLRTRSSSCTKTPRQQPILSRSASTKNTPVKGLVRQRSASISDRGRSLTRNAEPLTPGKRHSARIRSQSRHTNYSEVSPSPPETPDRRAEKDQRKRSSSRIRTLSTASSVSTTPSVSKSVKTAASEKPPDRDNKLFEPMDRKQRARARAVLRNEPISRTPSVSRENSTDQKLEKRTTRSSLVTTPIPILRRTASSSSNCSISTREERRAARESIRAREEHDDEDKEDGEKEKEVPVVVHKLVEPRKVESQGRKRPVADNADAGPPLRSRKLAPVRAPSKRAANDSQLGNKKVAEDTNMDSPLVNIEHNMEDLELANEQDARVEEEIAVAEQQIEVNMEHIHLVETQNEVPVVEQQIEMTQPVEESQIITETAQAEVEKNRVELMEKLADVVATNTEDATEQIGSDDTIESSQNTQELSTTEGTVEEPKKNDIPTFSVRIPSVETKISPRKARNRKIMEELQMSSSESEDEYQDAQTDFTPPVEAHESYSSSLDPDAGKRLGGGMFSDSDDTEFCIDDGESVAVAVPKSIVPSIVAPEAVVKPSVAPEPIVQPTGNSKDVVPSIVAPKAVVKPNVAPESAVQPTVVPKAVVPSTEASESVAPSISVPEFVIPSTIAPVAVVPSIVVPAIVPVLSAETEPVAVPLPKGTKVVPKTVRKPSVKKVVSVEKETKPVQTKQQPQPQQLSEPAKSPVTAKDLGLDISDDSEDDEDEGQELMMMTAAAVKSTIRSVGRPRTVRKTDDELETPGASSSTANKTDKDGKKAILIEPIRKGRQRKDAKPATVRDIKEMSKNAQIKVTNEYKAQLRQALMLKKPVTEIKLLMKEKGIILGSSIPLSADDAVDVMIEYLQTSSHSDMWQVLLQHRQKGNTMSLVNNDEQNFLQVSVSLNTDDQNLLRIFIVRILFEFATRDYLDSPQCGCYTRLFCHAIRFVEEDDEKKNEWMKNFIDIVLLKHESQFMKAIAYCLNSECSEYLKWFIQELEDNIEFSIIFKVLMHINPDQAAVVNWLINDKFQSSYIDKATDDNVIEVINNLFENYCNEGVSHLNIVDGEVRIGQTLLKYIEPSLKLAKTGHKIILGQLFNYLKKQMNILEDTFLKNSDDVSDKPRNVFNCPSSSSVFDSKLSVRDGTRMLLTFFWIRHLMLVLATNDKSSLVNAIVDALTQISPKIIDLKSAVSAENSEKVESNAMVYIRSSIGQMCELISEFTNFPLQQTTMKPIIST